MHREKYPRILFLNWDHSFLKTMQVHFGINVLNIKTKWWEDKSYSSLFNQFNLILAKLKHFQLKNVVIVLRTLSTQMRTLEFSLCGY